MPASPTPIYIVTLGSDQFPGYVQEEEQPLSVRTIQQNILNRNGGIASPGGAELMQISLNFIVLSQLDNVTELAHLNNCKEQYATARKIVARAQAMAELSISNSSRHVNAFPTSIRATLVAGTSRQIKYQVTFVAEPFYVGETAVSDTFTGNDTITLVFSDDTLETYPIFVIPDSVTAFVATHAASGKVVDFVRGSVSNAVTVNCGNFEVTRSPGGSDASITMDNVDFGMRHNSGAGTMSIVITGFAGSGTVTVTSYPRFAL